MRRSHLGPRRSSDGYQPNWSEGLDPTVDNPSDEPAAGEPGATVAAATGSYRTGSERYLHTGEIPRVDDMFADAARSAGVKVGGADRTADGRDDGSDDGSHADDAATERPSALEADDDALILAAASGGTNRHASSGGRLRRFGRRRPKTSVAILVVLALLIPVGISYAKAMTKEGQETPMARTAEWVRDMHLGFLVDWAEQRQYATDQFVTGGTVANDAFKPIDPTAAPTTASTVAEGTTAPPVPHTPVPIRMVSPVDPPAPGEGEWTPAGPLIRGLPGVYTTKVRPNAEHPSLTVFVSWTDPLLTNIKLFPGTELPGGEWATPHLIPPDQCSKVILASNGGFKLNDGASRGGYFAEGRESQWKLRDGAASLIFYKDGHIDVGQWGRDANRDRLGEIESVRQNLELLVDNGQPTPATKGDGDWGAKLPNSYFVWRSGYGVTKDGALVYAGGPALKPVELAQTLINAGAVRAMEGDINPEWVHAFLYNVSEDGQCHGRVVLDGPEDQGGMRAKPDRYLTVETRDFVVVSAKE
jgi:hypothetical protein